MLGVIAWYVSFRYIPWEDFGPSFVFPVLLAGFVWFTASLALHGPYEDQPHTALSASSDDALLGLGFNPEGQIKPGVKLAPGVVLDPSTGRVGPGY